MSLGALWQREIGPSVFVVSLHREGMVWGPSICEKKCSWDWRSSRETMCASISCELAEIWEQQWTDGWICVFSWTSNVKRKFIDCFLFLLLLVVTGVVSCWAYGMVMAKFQAHDARFCVLISSSLSLMLSCIVPKFLLVPLRPPSNFFIHSLALSLSTRSVQDTTPECVLSLCWCSLVLAPTTSKGIWHSAGATISWSRVVSLSCSCRISLCIRSNYDSGDWATRIIHFSLLVFSTVSITLIRQETISLAIRNHSIRPPMEGRLTCKDISPVVTHTKRVNLLQSTVYKIHSSAKSKALAVPER